MLCFMLHSNIRKTSTAIVLLAILFSGFAGKAQIKIDACSLLTDQQINTLLGCHLKQAGTAILKGARCSHKAADIKSELTIEYYDWHSVQTAADMMKLNHDDCKKKIALNKKAIDIYTAIKDFPEAGNNALIMTGEGSVYSNGNVVRIQFQVGKFIVTIDTGGIEMGKVVSKAKEIYNAIMANNK